MPRLRSKLARPPEPCDCLDCRSEFFPPDALAGAAVARQQPPPKCLVIYVPASLEVTISGAAPPLEEHPELPHIAAAAQAGCSGLLAFRPDADDTAVDQGVVLRNLLCQVPVKRQPEAKGAEERGATLRKLRGEFAAISSELRAPAEAAGFAAFHDLSRLVRSGSNDAAEELSPAAVGECADFIATRLGLPGAAQPAADAAVTAAESAGSAELLLLQLGPSISPASAPPVQPANDSSGAAQLAVADAARLAAADALLRALNGRPGFRDTVLLVLLLGISDPSGRGLPQLDTGASQAPLAGVRGYAGVTLPRQSCGFAGLDEVAIDRQHAILSIQRLPYVIRQDSILGLPGRLDSFRPGNGCMLAERLLPELAYKLGRAPKYGA